MCRMKCLANNTLIPLQLWVMQRECTIWIRAEQVKGDFDFIVSRAVTDLSQFVGWVKGKVSDSQYHKLRNGILYLKGGDLDEELAPFRKKVQLFDISDFFEEPYFDKKKVIYLPFR